AAVTVKFGGNHSPKLGDKFRREKCGQVMQAVTQHHVTDLVQNVVNPVDGMGATIEKHVIGGCGPHPQAVQPAVESDAVEDDLPLPEGFQVSDEMRDGEPAEVVLQSLNCPAHARLIVGHGCSPRAPHRTGPTKLTTVKRSRGRANGT